MLTLLQRVEKAVDRQNVAEKLYASHVRTSNAVGGFNMTDREKIALHGSYVTLRNISNKVKTLVDIHYHNKRLLSLY